MWARWHLNLDIFADVATYFIEFRREITYGFYKMILDAGSGCCRFGYMVDSGHIYNMLLHVQYPNFDIHLLFHASFQTLIHSIPISLILHSSFSLLQPLILNAFGEFIWTSI
ncbi:hypothetical protein Hanom_Chr10g00941981 [Helianthus anomalus]